MKELISLDGNGNKFRIIRGNDGDIHLGFDCPQKGVFIESVRVGVGNSGGQEVPDFVKRALINLFDAMEKWEEVEGKHCGECQWYRRNEQDFSRCTCHNIPSLERALVYAEREACGEFNEKNEK